MFQLLFERSADAIWLFDPEAAVFIDCNAAAVALMRGTGKDSLLHTNPADLSPPCQPDGRPSREAAEDVTALVARNGAHRFEWMARRLDGTEVPLEIIATAIQTQGRALHVVVSRDMSERRRMEADLRASEERWRLLFEQSPLSVHTFASDGSTRQVNRAWERLFGLTRADLARFNILQDRRLAEAGVMPHIHRAFAGEVVSVPPVRFELPPAAGQTAPTLKWIGAIMFPLRDEDGRVIEVVCVHEDTTERKLAEDEIRRLNTTLERRVIERTAELTASEARLRTLIEHAPEAIVVFDGESGRFLECNDNAVRLFGLSGEQLRQLHPAEVSPLVQTDGRLSSEAMQEQIQAALAGATPVFDWLHKHASGRLIPCEVRLVRLPGEGRPLVRGSVTDNSERKRREKIQQATYQISEAVHAAEDLESFYARIHATVRGLMPAENFYIALFDSTSRLISFPYYVDERSRKPDPFRVETGLTGYVLRTGSALLMDAAMNARKRRIGSEVTFDGFEEIRYEESGEPAAIWLGVPLSIQGKPIGVMAVQDYHDGQAYDQEDKQILAFVATQTALAIERKRGEQALLKRAEQMRRHRNVLLELALRDKSDFAAALDVICARSAGTFQVSRVGYWSLQDHNTALVCETLHRIECGGSDAAARGVRVEARNCPVYFKALAAREPIIAHNAATHPATYELNDGYLRPLGITSMLDVPVWLHGLLVGVLCHEHIGDPREWTPEEIDFAGSVANMVSLSLEAAQRARSDTALRASETRLRESEARFSAAFHANPVCTTLARMSDGRFVEANEAFLEWFGSGPREVLGRTSIDLDLWADAEARTGFWQELSGQGRIRHRECDLRSRRGAVHTMLLSADIIEINQEPHILTVGLDINDRKQAEAELLKALDREKELSQLKSNFVSMVSHEFRTPLGVIMSSAEILDDYLDQLEAHERQQHLRSITRNTRRMADLMEEVLVLGRLDAGRMDFAPAPLDLRAFTARLVDEVLASSEQRCPIELYFAAIPEEARADERLLRHALVNVLSNAVKYSEPGRPIRFSLDREGREAICRIQDQGIGIPEADHAWLFKAFHRGRNVGPRPGTGLGLVIVKRCVELHRGRIVIESKPGQGTTVTLRLPVFDPATALA